MKGFVSVRDINAGTIFTCPKCGDHHRVSNPSLLSFAGSITMSCKCGWVMTIPRNSYDKPLFRGVCEEHEISYLYHDGNDEYFCPFCETS